jgi:hypothetical protein
MKNIIRIALLVLIIPAIEGNAKSVVSTVVRNEKIELAKSLLESRTQGDSSSFKGLTNPFSTSGRTLNRISVKPKPGISKKIYTDSEIVKAVAAKINPTGIVRIGGEYFLLFGQKRLKVGDILTINYKNQSYPIIISAIKNNQFTVRLNGEEIVKSIN